MSEEVVNKNAAGLPMFHLRRVGPPASKPGVTDVMDFYKVTYIIGRSQDKVDYWIDSSIHKQSASLSRCHARVVRQAQNQHNLHDDSLNGVFVNNIKISGSCMLREGDRVTFGHIYGQKLPYGSRARQPDSEHQFIFELCQCEQPVQCGTPKKSTPVKQAADTACASNQTDGFKMPVTPLELCQNTARSRRAARATQSFTPDDVRNLKSAWENHQLVESSNSDLPHKPTAVATDTDSFNQLNDENRHEQSECIDISGVKDLGTEERSDMPQRPVKAEQDSCTEAETPDHEQSTGTDENNEDACVNNESAISIVVETKAEVESKQNTEHDKKKTEQSENEDSYELEGAANAILENIRSLNRSLEEESNNSRNIEVERVKSPTMDACIQTTQSLHRDTGVRGASPTADVEIQTSQMTSAVAMVTSEGSNDNWAEMLKDDDADINSANIPMKQHKHTNNNGENKSEDGNPGLDDKCFYEDEIRDNGDSESGADLGKVYDCGDDVDTCDDSNHECVLISKEKEYKTELESKSEQAESDEDDDGDDDGGIDTESHYDGIVLSNSVEYEIESDSEYQDGHSGIVLSNSVEYDFDGNDDDDDELHLGDIVDSQTKSELENSEQIRRMEKSRSEEYSEIVVERDENVEFDMEIVEVESVSMETMQNDGEMNVDIDKKNENMENLMKPDCEKNELNEEISDDNARTDENVESTRERGISAESVNQDETARSSQESAELTVLPSDDQSDRNIDKDESYDDEEWSDLEDGDDQDNDSADVNSVEGKFVTEDNVVESINKPGTRLVEDIYKQEREPENVDFDDDKGTSSCDYSDPVEVETNDHVEKIVVENEDVPGMSDDNAKDEALNETNDEEDDENEGEKQHQMVKHSVEILHPAYFDRPSKNDDGSNDDISIVDVMDLQSEAHIDSTKSCEESLGDNSIGFLSGKKKRHMSADICDKYCDDYEGTRKRHRSESHTDGLKASHEACEDRVQVENGHESTLRFHKLRHGVLKFFKSWRQKTFKVKSTCSNSLSKAMEPHPTPKYVYLKDTAGQYRRLSLEGPKLLTDRKSEDDLETVNTDKDPVIVGNDVANEEFDNKMVDNLKADLTKNQGMLRNVDESVNIEPDTENELQTNSSETLENKDLPGIQAGISENSPLRCADNTDDTEEEQNTSMDVVEASVCYTDDDPEMDLDVPVNSWLRNANVTPVKVTPRKQLKAMSSPLMSPIIEKQGSSPSNDNVSKSLTQSPIIGKLETASVRLREITAKMGNVIKEATAKNDSVEPSSQLSCRFSDDEDMVPEIDLSHLDDNFDVSNSNETDADSKSVSKVDIEVSVPATSLDIGADMMIETVDKITGDSAMNEENETGRDRDEKGDSGDDDDGVDNDDDKNESDMDDDDNDGEDEEVDDEEISDTGSDFGYVSRKHRRRHGYDWYDEYCSDEEDEYRDSAEDYDDDDHESEKEDNVDEADDEGNGDVTVVHDDDDGGIESSAADATHCVSEGEVDLFIINEEDPPDVFIVDRKVKSENEDCPIEVSDGEGDEFDLPDLDGADDTEQTEQGMSVVDLPDIKAGDEQVEPSDLKVCVVNENGNVLKCSDGKMKTDDLKDKIISTVPAPAENKQKVGVKRKCDFDSDCIDTDGPGATDDLEYDISDINSDVENSDNNKKDADFNLVTTAFAKTFKTPQSIKKQRAILESSAPDSPGLSSTQLLNSTQTPDLNDLSMSQVSKVTQQLEVKVNDGSRSDSARSKAKQMLERLRAKKRVKRESESDDSSNFTEDSRDSKPEEQMQVEVYNMDGPSTSRATEAEQTNVDVERHVASCRQLIDELKVMFAAKRYLHQNPRVIAWRKELEDIESKLTFPKTVIAVVGDTGAGKSSLMNAILDQRSVLPTSGMRACTAVVVEVVQNTTSNYFEADIEFLQKKEWFAELQVLLKDLTAMDGSIKKGTPDPTSDAFVSYCKVRAVYGRVDRFEVLSRIATVTHWLGRVKVVKSTKPEDFRRQVEKYIETQDPGAGGQYWPIVKHVRLRLPQCDVCSSGAALVDLPGVRDSNAARDKIAKEYLKNCTAVWVVSSIHRAIDDKTAKDLLGETFRRQLLMDGQYGSIAFICTKTDVLMPSEIIRSLHLEDETRDHEAQVSEMEQEKADLDLSVVQGNREMRLTTGTVKTLKGEVEELRANLEEIRNLLGSEAEEQSEEQEALKEYQDELAEKERQLEQCEERIQEIYTRNNTATQKMFELEQRLNVHRKAISAICAKARNEYSKTQIRRDFKAGLREMKRRAGMLDRDDDGEEEDLYDDDDDDDDDEVGSSADNLKVFCCSSTEYQKMRNLLTDDGPPQVFTSVEETQVPDLRRYVHEMTSIRRRQAVERLVTSLGRYVFDLHIYTTEGGATSLKGSKYTKSAIDAELSRFDESLAPVLRKLSSDIDSIFDGSIRSKMEEGAASASAEANNTCAKWGAPYIRDKTKDRRQGGLHFATYRATTRRHGVFTSPTYGPVDFNEDLAEPMYRSMTIVWDRAFSGMLWKVLDTVKADILWKLRQFTTSLGDQLLRLGIAKARSARVSLQLQASAEHKLTDMVGQLKDLVTTKQRDISRIVTPHVQTSLSQQYDMCAGESGGGMFIRMKTYMSQGIDCRRMTMFDEATEKLMSELMTLQTEILNYARCVCKTLLEDLRTAFEPLWEAPSNSLELRNAFQQPVNKLTDRVRQIYQDAGIDNTLGLAILPAATSHDATSTHNASVSSASTSHNASLGSQSATGVSGHMSVTNPQWQTYGETFHKKEDTSYGSCEQYGQVGVRVKTERVAPGCITETMETVSMVHKVHVKQEKPNSVRSNDSGLANFGQQTLQDLQCGKLEVSPLEVTTNALSSCATSTLSRHSVATAPGNTTAPSYNNSATPTGETHSGVGNRSTVCGESLLTREQQFVIGANQSTSSAMLDGHMAIPTMYISPESSIGQTIVANGQPQYAIMQTLPNGQRALTPCQLAGIQPAGTPTSSQVTIKVPKTKVPQQKITVTPLTKGKENVINPAAGPSKVQSSILAFSRLGSSTFGPVQTNNLGTSQCLTSSVKGQTKVVTPGNTGQINVQLSTAYPKGKSPATKKGKSPASRGNTPQTKDGKRRNLSLSQRNSPVQVPSPQTITIKTEPVDTGYGSRIKRANKNMGMIDLTDD